jgi:multidrug efflux system membrane fusion protein
MTTGTAGDKEPTMEGVPLHANRWIFIVVGLLLLGGALAYFRAKARTAATAAAASASAAADRVIPVIVVPVALRNMPIYLEGLGNVVPIATVTVKTQVDGRLDQVAFKEGQMMHRGELLAQVDPRPFLIQLHTAEATLAKDAAQLRNAKLNLERYKTLRQQNLIPQQQVDDQQTMVDQFDAAIRSDQTQIDTARLNLDYARIVTPVDGVTGVRLVDPGNIVHAADQGGIVVVTQLDPIAVLFTLPEDDLPRVSKQLAAGPLKVEAYSRDGLTKLGDGKLGLVDNEINQATASIRLKAFFPNTDRTLWPNQFVKIRLQLATREGALVVPATVVQRGPQGTFAYVVGTDQTVSMRPVEVDTTQGDSAIIARGLSVGEQVVADGQNQLRPGAKIAPRPAERPATASPLLGATASAAPSASPPAASSSGGGPRP